MFEVGRSMFNVSALAVPLDGELLELVFGDYLESNVNPQGLTPLNPRGLPPLTSSFGIPAKGEGEDILSLTVGPALNLL